MSLTEEQRARTLERFEKHRRAWDENPALRVLYGDWSGRIAAELPPVSLGPRLELGSGPGFARRFIADLELSDIVRAPWHDREVSADALPFGDASLGALVLFDVLHHLPAPRRFFAEAVRVLRPGGRIVLCEPYVSPASYPVYKFLHEEPVVLDVDPLADQAGPTGRDPFDSNQAIPTLLFGRGRALFEAAFPALAVGRIDHLAGPSYPASGGFSRRPFVPLGLWSALHRLEARFPKPLIRWLAFRIIVTIERR
jgi:SAM-dependent methyltransferase